VGGVGGEVEVIFLERNEEPSLCFAGTGQAGAQESCAPTGTFDFGMVARVWD
jgi:hypothetical protein